jgi:Spy/CpxP family protein refolding chaperone
MAKTLFALMVSLCLAFPVAAAQSKTESKKPAKPAWTELTPSQQQVLAPLAGEWERMDTTRRRKWIAIAERYPKMKPQEQQRLQARMKEWAALTPEQQRAAREKYQRVKKLPPEKRKEVKQQWQEYQQSLAPQVEAPGGDAAAAESATETQSPAPVETAPSGN